MQQITLLMWRPLSPPTLQLHWTEVAFFCFLFGQEVLVEKLEVVIKRVFLFISDVPRNITIGMDSNFLTS